MRDSNKSEPATKADLKELEQKLSSKIISLDKKTDSLDKKIGSVEQKLSLKIESVETTVNHLAVELAKAQADVREIKYDMATKMSTKDDISRIMAHIDGFAAQALSYSKHDTIRGNKIMEHESKLENHEGRLILLEKPE